MPTGTPTRPKICPLCGDEFIPEKPSSRYCKKDHFQPCPVCGKPVLWNSKKPVPACSKECKRELRKMHNREKWGVDHPMQLDSVKEKHRESMLERYGVESPLQSDEIKAKAVESNLNKFGTEWALGNKEFHERCFDTMEKKYGARTSFEAPELVEKAKKTNRKKYGFDNPMQSEEVKNKVKITCLERYGTENPLQSEEIKAKAKATRASHQDEITEKIRQTFRENYGVDNCRQSPIVIAKIKRSVMEHYGVDSPVKSKEVREKIMKTTMERYGVPWYVMSDEYVNNGVSNKGKISNTNKRFATLLHKLGLTTEFEFAIKDKSYDIHIVGTNVLIEIDPSYTHNTEGANHFHRKISEQYHLEKTLVAERNGYRCIHVFDWDDLDKVANLIAPTKRIYARNCGIVKIINQSVANKFINENHLQGQARGSILTLGLTYEGEIVEAMSFGRSRYDKKHTYELLRLCSKQGTTVVGGASKLFKFATEQLDLDDIISYCDRSKFNGAVYEKIGMKLIRETNPNIVWSRDSDKITSNLLRQRGYDQLFKTNYGKGTDNDILMLVNGWVPVPDCGQKVFSYRSNL